MSNDKLLKTSRVFVTNPTTQMDVSGSMIGVTVADGADAALGSKADVVASTDTGTFSLIALTKRISQWLNTMAGYLQSLATTISGTSLRVLATQVTSPWVVSGSVTATPAALPAAPVNGRAVVLVTNTAVQLASNVLVNGVIVEALAGNSDNVYVGNSTVTTANGYELQPGGATSAGVLNTSAIWVNGASGDGVAFIGS